MQTVPQWPPALLAVLLRGRAGERVSGRDSRETPPQARLPGFVGSGTTVASFIERKVARGLSLNSLALLRLSLDGFRSAISQGISPRHAFTARTAAGAAPHHLG